jgi:hypothetical protein
MSRYYDKKSKEAAKLKVGDLMMLNSKNLRTRRPSRKLDHKMHGPFQIEKLISPTAVSVPHSPVRTASMPFGRDFGSLVRALDGLY